MLCKLSTPVNKSVANMRRIMFMREFKIIKSESSALALRRALKNEELERYGEPFTPEFVYEAIRQLPRFASMRVSFEPPLIQFSLTNR